MAIETLRCKAGHDFTRESVRGRKPQWCPDHRPMVAKPAERRTEAPEPTESKGDKPILSAALIKALVAETAEAISELPEGDETRRKLQYISKQIKRGHREAEDIKLLRNTRDRLLSDLRRRNQVSV